MIGPPFVFLSTLSLRRATVPHVYIPGHRWISIHALLAESDLDDDLLTAIATLFLSTLSLRRATVDTDGLVTVPPEDFYPRSPCGERRTKKLRIPVPAYFYPRSPCGERLYDTYAKVLRVNISIHALLAESDSV